MKKRKRKRKPAAIERLQRSAAAMANATKGRARVFKDRKKEQARKACRKHENES